ncbi:hypothetical protein TK90_2640 (plasmid) [Thioalkalivibrio sp. K90mix]|nr:hypothetical protein TK90_2640 [Thioalkalivibrio sp. K90mix]
MCEKAQSHYESTLAEMEGLIERFRGLVAPMPHHGDKCEDSQKQCLLQALSQLEQTVNGLEPKDFASTRSIQ